MHRPALVPLGLLACTLFAGCAVTPKVDSEAEAAAIRALDSRFGAAVAKLDVVAATALYAPDASVMPPGLPTVRGTAEIRTMLAGLFTAPGLSITLHPERIDIASAGDLATDAGTVEVGMNTAQGPVIEGSKYLEVWRKVNGEWKLMYDTWNANSPTAKPAADTNGG